MKTVVGSLAIAALLIAAGLAYAQPLGAGAEPKLVQPAAPGEKFMELTVGNVKVLYQEGWRNVAQKLAEKTDAVYMNGLKKAGLQPKSAIEITVRTVVPDDLALCMPQPQADLQKKSIRYPIAVAEGGAGAFSLDDLKVEGCIQGILNFAFVFDIIGANADSIQNSPRWFLYGLGTYLGAGAAREMAGADAEKLLQTQWGDKILEHYKDQLLKWTDKNPGQFDQAYVLGCAQMFAEIEKKFGAAAIARIGAAYVNSPKADTDSLVKLISDAIGQDFAGFLQAYTAPKHPTLGVVADKDFAGPGVKVLGVQPDTCGAEAGFVQGDIILKVNDMDLKDAGALKAVVEKAGVGGMVKITVKRGEVERETPVTITEPVFQYPPPPGTKPPEGQAPEAMGPPTDEEIIEIFKSSFAGSGFTRQQAEILFKYFGDGKRPAGTPGLDQETVNMIMDYLKGKGFSQQQAQLLLVAFKVNLEGVKAIAGEKEKAAEANKDENLTPEEMLENLGWDKAMAKLMCVMMRNYGKTDEQIKADIRAGKVQKPNMGPPPEMPPGGMPVPPPPQP
jgi:hypothetical protein